MSNTKLKTSAKPLVLVVDDEETICSSLSDVLVDEGFDTITALDGKEALRLVMERSPSLVFLDIWMPGQDGIETLEGIKRIAPDTAVVMISGHATISNALEAIKRGAFDLIEKPLDIESIILSAKRALERVDVKQQQVTSELTAVTESGRFVQVRAHVVPTLSHPGVLSTGLKGANVGQRTIKQSAVLYGHCLHSGQKSGLVLEPLPANSGIHFARIGDSKSVPAFVDHIESTDFATRLRSGTTNAATIEHLMAALHAYKISNLLIKCNGEVPIFDGSSNEFCKIIEEVGIEEQSGDWFEIAVQEPMTIEVTGKGAAKAGGALEQLRIEPSDTFKLSYELHYPAPVGSQKYEYEFRGIEDFKKEIAPARTFGFMRDIERLQKAGLAAGGRLDNFILIGEDGVINTELRFEEELARHKVLDLIGDIFLLGRPVRAKITAVMTGHTDNIRVLKALRDKVLGSH